MDSFVHDPDAVLDYAQPFTLPTGDTISTATATVETGDVTIDLTSDTDSVVTAWVSGGTVNTDATIRFRITTAQGRTDDRAITLYVRER
jgi:hypothetical protein